jgi:hypothetical protein
MFRRTLCGLLFAVQAIAVDAMAIGVPHNPQANDISGNSAYEQYQEGKQVAVAIVDWLDVHNGAVTAAATIAIAIFTYFLVKVSSRQAILTRESVDLARSEFIASHRPKVIARWFDEEGLRKGKMALVHFTAVNAGDSAAILTHIGSDVGALQGGAWLGEGVDYTPTRLPHPVRLESGGSVIFSCGSTAPLEISADKFAFMPTMIGLGEVPPKICAVGEIVYRDLNDVQRRTGFLRSYNAMLERFETVADSDYEYAD